MISRIQAYISHNEAVMAFRVRVIGAGQKEDQRPNRHPRWPLEGRPPPGHPRCQIDACEDNAEQGEAHTKEPHQGTVAIQVSNQTPTVIPNSGTPFTLTFTASQVANIKSKITRSKDLISYGNSFEGVSNATDSGGSGGLGPGTVTLVNSTAVY